MRLLVQWFNRLAAAYEEMTGQSYDGDCKENLHEQGHERSDKQNDHCLNKQNDHCLNKQIDHFLEVSNEEAFSELEAFTALISDELERLNQKDKCNDENDLSLLQMIPSSPDPNLFASLRRPETDYSMAVCLTTSLIRREEDRNLITQFIFTFKEASIQDDFQDGQITHVIVGGDGGGGCRTLKSMLGILDGCWLVGMDWIRASLGAGQIVKEDSFEISSGSGRSRLSRSLGEAPLLFGMAIYLYGQFGRNLDQIRRLLLHAGATLIPDIDALVALDTGSTARRRRGSNRILVLCDPKEQGDFERDAGVIARFRPILDVSWLFESIASFQIADPRDHIVI